MIIREFWPRRLAPAALAACARCQEPHAEARRIIEQAGGIAKWMEWVAR
jgi:hypothetical protein